MSVAANTLHGTITLQHLLQGIVDAPSLPITGLQDDSRYLQPGDAFVAVQGANQHGLEYVERAVRQGAAAIVWDSSTGNAAPLREDCPVIAVPDLASQLGDLANRFHNWPSSAIDVTGITGTNGKTTVAYLLAQAWTLLDKPCAYLGTLGFGVGELAVDRGLTTPPCLDLHNKLAGFRDVGASAAAIEVSSHALAQGRTAGVRFATAVFTNLSRDHVDYHGDMLSYAAAKARLFTDFECEHRVVNIDSDYGDFFMAKCGPEAIVTTAVPHSDVGKHRYVRAADFKAVPGGSRISLASSWGNAKLDLPLIGAFNVSNALQVLAALFAQGVSFAKACDVLSACTPPPGRMQSVAIDTGDAPATLPAVYVDYAHTPAALESALTALRPHVSGKVWCVFGCGGDRDAGKRPQMGEIAGRLADRSVVTNDNPRSESPAGIIADIVAGMSAQQVAIEDRGAAIAFAIREAAADDAVLIAGKGHEDYQIIGDRRLDFSDYQAARANLAKRLAGKDGRHA